MDLSPYYLQLLVSNYLRSSRCNYGPCGFSDAIKAITSLKGVGFWNAEIYLMLYLERQDIFPADDLGLLVARFG
ncbi:MAG: hypothetical protein COB27_009890 [Moritella sp.]|uniref:hypothetical protein n=1 Tax=Moritella sp. TaxID=78556 RepID=UPI0021716F01|nr:hypothetical protein [Moritella sp.]MBL1417175.1 hypothetical protein [Moritella sp.]